ncbi:SRPBCC family protein [Agaribacter marinus]|uniref:Activator of Hsp90 ATPase homologue 1/2-like C-terminal domain-containing protein n=1 Tax=Agaribacter marinus TaxID=1431249 RepID=A0AA37WLN2_9ALTE|nr:SRPBCC domain-containing protein [Agaribacter marinus]GLR72829.1 hypothetical protein GCM10007852_37370 [Agaribacter marinus]
MYKFTLRGNLNAPISEVYKAFSDPERIAKWWAPGKLSVCRYVGEVAEGEQFRLVMQSDDGFQQSVEGMYNTVETNKRVSFTWRWEDTHEMTKVSVSFEPQKNQNTKFELSQNGFKYHNDMLQQQYAWLDCLEKLSSFLPNPSMTLSA